MVSNGDVDRRSSARERVHRPRRSPGDLPQNAALPVAGVSALDVIATTTLSDGTIGSDVDKASKLAYALRTREIGVRITFGAQRWSVRRMVLRDAVWLTTAGIAIGAACSLAFGELLRGLLFGVSACDVSTLATVATVLGLLAPFAGYIPAHRAASVNPVEGLLAE